MCAQHGVMNLARFPRRRYTPSVTPLELLPRLSAALKGPEIWIKRDDLLGLAAGGNKTRKLEFLVAEALAQGADTLITVGAPQSNHCRLTLAAAAKEGLKCRLIIEERVPGTYNDAALGNHLLFDLMGVESLRVVPLGTDFAAEMTIEAASVRAAGGRPYTIAGGGSTPLGALGYAACAEEIMTQSFDLGVALDAIVVASGSAGTHSGLLAGLTALNANIPLTGINVRRPRAEQEGNVHKLAVATAQLLGTPAPNRDAVVALDDWVGPGYSLPTPEMVAAVRLLASSEGILLDPVYSGKAMAGLIGLIGRGDFKAGQRVCFVHTGGSPSLHAYAHDLRNPSFNS
jgi:D-cysteine desulfhydrase